MADVSRSVEIEVKVIGDAVKKLTGINTLLGGLKQVVDGLASNISTVSEGVGKLGSAIQPLSTFNADGIVAFADSLKPLAKFDSSNLSKLGTSLESIAKFKAPQGFAAFTNSLVQLGSISKFPSLTGVGAFLAKVGEIQKMPPIGTFVKNLQLLASIEKFPSLGPLAASLKTLSGVGTLPQIGTFTKSLKGLSGIGELPSLKPLATGLKELSGIGTLPVIPQGLGKAIKEFDGIGKLPALKAFAVGLKELSGIGTLPTIPEGLGKAVKGFEGIGKLPALKAFADGLKAMSGISNLPVIPEGLGKSIKAFEGIGKLPSLKAFATGLKTLSGATNLPVIPEGLGKSIKAFEGIGKLPPLKAFAIGLKELSGIGKIKAIPEGVVTAIERFARIKTSDLPKLGTFAKSLSELNKAATGKGTAKLAGLYEVIKKFSKIEKVPSVAKITNALNGLATINMPDFTNVINGVNKLAKAFKKIEKSSPVMTMLMKIGNAAETLEKKMTFLEKSVKKTSNSFQELGKRLKNYVMYRIIADSVIAAKEAFTGASEAIIDYDQSLKNLQAIMQATDDEVRQMGVAIEDVASGTKFSAQEVADGMQILGQAGLTSAEAVSSIQAVADLATGTLTNMSTSVDLVTTSLRVFGIQAKDSAHVADVFANAVNGSKLTIDKLRTAMNYVGPIAKSAGVSLEETSAAMMTLANSGQRASTIGTGLRRMFAELIDPSEKMTAAAERAGISLDELNPSANDLSDVLRSLGVVITDADVAFDLFGKRGAAAVLSLTNDVTGGFEAMMHTTNRFGTAAAMAKKQMEGLGVSFKNLQDKIKLVAIAMGKAGMISAMKVFVDMLRDLADSTVWLIDNAIAPLLGTLKPLGNIFAALPAVIQATAVAVGVLALQFKGLSGAVAFLGNTSIVARFKSAGAAASEAGIAAAAASPRFYKLAGAFSAVRTAIASLLGRLGLIGAAIIGLAAAYALLTENTDKQIASFEKIRNEIDNNITSVDAFSAEVEAMSNRKLADGELIKFLDQLTDKFPELSAEVYGAEDPLLAAADALDKLKKSLNDQKYEEAIKGLDGYVDKLQEATKKFDNTRMIKGIFRTEDQWKKDTATAEREMRAAMGRVTKIVSEALQRGETIDWHEMFDVPVLDQQMQDMRDTILEGAQKIVDDTNKIDVGSAFNLYGVTAQWDKELGGTRTVLRDWLNDVDKGSFDLLKSNERYYDLITGISKATIEGYVKAQDDLIKEMKKAESELQGDELNAKRREIAQKSLELQSKMNNKMAENNDAYRINQYVQLVKWEEKERARRLKGVTDREQIQKIEYDIWLEGQKKLEAAMNTTDTGDALKNFKNASKLKEKEFKSHQEELSRIAASGSEDRDVIDAQMANNSVQYYNEIYLAAKLMYDNIKNDSNSSKDQIEKAAQELSAAKLKAEQAQTDAVKAHTDLRIAEQKREYISRKEEIETGSAKILASIEAQETAGVLSYEEAELAKTQATLNRYKQISQAARAYRDEAVPGTKDWEDRNKVLLNADQAYYEKKVSLAQTANNKINDLNKQIIASNKKIVTEQKKNASTIKKEEAKLVRKLDKLFSDYDDSREDSAKDLANKITDIEYDLAKTLNDIEYDLNEKRKNYADERLEREKKLAADLEGIENDTQDSLDKVRQRGMTDKQKARDNEGIAARKYAEAVKLRQEAERTGNADLLKESDDLLSSAQSLAEGYENVGKAKSMINSIGDAKKANAITEKEIKDLEAIKKLNEEIAKAEKKKNDAVAASNHKIELAQREHDDKMDKMARELEQAVANAKASHKITMDAEAERHRIKMANLADEIELANKEVELNKKLASGVAADKIDTPVTQKAPVADPTGATDSAISNALDKSNKLATESTKKLGEQYTKTSSVIQSQQEEIATNGYRVIEENGKKIYTNLTDDQRAFTTAFADGMQQAGESMKQVGDQGKAEFTRVYDEAGRLKEVFAEGMSIKINDPEIPDLRSAIPEEVPVEIRVDKSMERVNGYIDSLQSKIAGIGEDGSGLKIIGPEQKAEIDAVAEQLSQLYSGLSTDDEKQKLQDMITVVNSLGPVSDSVQQQFSEAMNNMALSIDGVSLQEALTFDDGVTKHTWSIIDETGKKVEGLSSTIKSNPFDLFGDFANEEIINNIQEIEGATEHLRSRVTEETELAINTERTQAALEDLKKQLADTKTVADDPIVPVADTSEIGMSFTQVEQDYQDMMQSIMSEPIVPVVELDESGTEAVEEAVEEAKDKVENSEPAKVPIEPDATKVDEVVTETKDKLDELDQVEVQPTITLESLTDEIQTAENALAALADSEVSIEILVDNAELEDAIKEIQKVTSAKHSIQIQITVTGTDDLRKLISWLEQLDQHNPKDVQVTTKVTGYDEVVALKQAIDSLTNKTVQIIAKVSGIDQVRELKNAIDQLKDKTVTVTTIQKTVEQKEAGGPVGFFAAGGNVFRKLASPFISRGSGTKDDVPAMLMKGEFVHKVSAVRKYGRQFMDMVNQGLYPVELARKAVPQFNTGGPVAIDFDSSSMVQNFAKGGSVLSGLIGSMRRKLYELFGTEMGGDVSMNVDTVNFQEIVSANAQNISTPMGVESINKMTEAFTDTVQGFYTGGPITNIDTTKIDATMTGINQAYDKIISAAYANGGYERVNILEAERKALLEISAELKAKVLELTNQYNEDVADAKETHAESIADAEETYNESVDDRTESHNETLADNQESYDESVADENESYNESKEDNEEDYADTEETYNEDSAENLADYNEDVADTEADYEGKMYEMWSDFIGKQKAARDAVGTVNARGTTMGAYHSNGVWGNFYPYSDWDIPNWETLKNTIEYYWYSKDLSYNVRNTQKKKALAEAASEWAAWLDSIRALKDAELVKGYDSSRTNIGLSSILDGTADLQSLAESIANANKEEELAAIKEDFDEEQAGYDENWNEYKEDYAETAADNKEDHEENLADYLESYTETKDDENESYAEDLADYLESHSDSVESADETLADALESLLESYEDSVASETENSESATEARKEETQKDLQSLADKLAEETSTEVPTTASVKAEEQIATERSNTLDDLLRKLKITSLFGFNTGGEVPHTSFSVPGKDSIMAALTPGEFVMKEGVVSTFGTGFFEALNNFRIPRFNMGGVVGTVANNAKAMQTIQHTLELTVNGNTHEPLSGTSAGIDAILNDLALAKMRT
jgi:TP901 family phage tail tape measure protein